MALDFEKLKEEIHENAVLKGFWDNPDCQRSAALINSEIGEMLEAHRTEKHAQVVSFLATADEENFKETFELMIKDSLEDELADIIIRSLDLAGWLGINIEKDSFGIMSADDSYFFVGDESQLFKNVNIITFLLSSMAVSGFDTLNGLDSSSMFQKVIRLIFGIAEYFSCSIEFHILHKMKYNKTRDRLHGKKY